MPFTWRSAVGAAPRTPSGPAILRSGLVALAAASLVAGLALEREVARAAGLRLAIHPAPEASAPPIAPPRLPASGLSRSARHVDARFSGYWWIPSPGARRLRLVSNGDAELRLASQTRLERRDGDDRVAVEATLELPAGPLRLDLSFAGPAAGGLRLLQGGAGEPLAPLDPLQLFPETPSLEEVHDRSRLRTLWRTGWTAVAASLCLAAPLAWRRRQVALKLLQLRARRVAVLAAALVVAYAGALRFEALVTRYWEAQGAPGWALLARDAIEPLRPRSIRWSEESAPYSGDPFTYLRFARERRGLFDAHVREPLFVLSAGALIRLTGDRDIGLNLTSLLYGTLLVAGACALGARLAGAVAGLATGLALAIHADLIGLAVEGWRDDAYAFLVVLSAWSLVGLQRRPGAQASVVAGLCMSAACLTRLSALALALPALAWSLLASGAAARLRWRAAAWTLVVMATLVGPYMAACAVAFGDPLYPISYHTTFYRLRQGLDGASAMGVAEFLAYGRAPVELAETTFLGLTSVPFENKWAGYGDWSPLLGPVLAGLAGAGTLAWAVRLEGRLLLVCLAGTLLPYATTWPIPGGAEWRFTAPAVPLYVVAGVMLAAAALRVAVGGTPGRAAHARALAYGLGTAGVLALALLGVGNWLRYERVAEDVRLGRSSIIEAGYRDLRLLRGGWSLPERRGNLLVRRATAGEVRLPLLEGKPCSLEIQMEAPQGEPSVLLNGWPAPVRSVPATEGRMGSYEVLLPAERVRAGVNRLELRAPPGGELTFARLRVDASRR